MTAISWHSLVATLSGNKTRFWMSHVRYWTLLGDYRWPLLASPPTGLLLRHLVGIAREANLSRFEADVLAENQPMLNVFRRAGLPMAQRRDGNVIHVTLSLKTDANPKD
jgi:hypothetical protein